MKCSGQIRLTKQNNGPVIPRLASDQQACSLRACTVVVALITPPAHADSKGRSPYLLFVPAVLVAAGVGRLGPGLLATASASFSAGVIMGIP
jgi:hypothetical protein